MSTKLKPGIYQAYTPKGDKIIGTLETIPGIANLYGFEVGEDGSIEIEYAGETTVEWNGQVTERDKNGDRIFVDEHGDTWSERDVTFKES